MTEVFGCETSYWSCPTHTHTQEMRVPRSICARVFTESECLEPWAWKKWLSRDSGAPLALFWTPCSPNTSTANRCKEESKLVPRWLPPRQSTDAKSIWFMAWLLWRWHGAHGGHGGDGGDGLRCHHYHHCEWCAAASFVNVVPWGPWNTFREVRVSLLAFSHLPSPFAEPWFRCSRIHPHPNLALGFLNAPESQPEIRPNSKMRPGFTTFSHVKKIKKRPRCLKNLEDMHALKPCVQRSNESHFCHLAQTPNMYFPHVEAQKMLYNYHCCNLRVSRVRLSKTVTLFGASLPS